MSTVSRRGFLAGSAATLLLPHAQVLGANEDIRVAVVGFNSRGVSHIDTLAKMKGVRLVGLCDVDPAVLRREVAKLDRQGIKVDSYSDVRRLLERKDLDAITTATPNHWHSLIGIWACQAGKDAYIEKPISHNVWEGRQLVKAARKYERIVQGGTQSRSDGRIRAAVEWVRGGNLGKIKAAYGFCYKPRLSIGDTGKGEIPEGLDYDLWTGPAPMKPLARKNLHYDWHWVYDTGNGDMGNQGIHQMDIARWFLGVNHLSPRVISIGGRLGYRDDGETPNTQVVYHDYDGAPLIFETRGLPRSSEFHSPSLWPKNMDSPDWFAGGRGVSVMIDCEGGRIFDGSGQIAAYDRDGKRIREFEPMGGGDHIANFIDAVRARKREMLTADCEETHLSSALCHTGLISHRLGKAAQDGEIRERIKSEPFSEERFQSMKEHLARNGVDISGSRLTLGEWLTFDPSRERFVRNDEANRLARPNYRAPFVVPEKV